MLMSFKTKGNKIKTKDKIEPQYCHRIRLRYRRDDRLVRVTKALLEPNLSSKQSVSSWFGPVGPKPHGT